MAVRKIVNQSNWIGSDGGSYSYLRISSAVRTFSPPWPRHLCLQKTLLLGESMFTRYIQIQTYMLSISSIHRLEIIVLIRPRSGRQASGPQFTQRGSGQDHGGHTGVCEKKAFWASLCPAIRRQKLLSNP